MKILKSVLFGAALLASSSAVAGRASQTFGVRLVVEDACRVDAARFEPARLQQAREARPADGVEVNCKGAINCVGAVLPGMLERGRGHIINISSDAGRTVYPGLAYYNAAERGGHFAAWEEPSLFTSELRAAFRPLR